jgi:hypothetical protein
MGLIHNSKLGDRIEMFAYQVPLGSIVEFAGQRLYVTSLQFETGGFNKDGTATGRVRMTGSSSYDGLGSSYADSHGSQGSQAEIVFQCRARVPVWLLIDNTKRPNIGVTIQG